MSFWYCDPIGGDDTKDGSTFIKRTKSLSILTPSQGDTVKIIESGSPFLLNGGSNCQWTQGSSVVALNTAVTRTISTFETNWTGVLCTTTLTGSIARQGTNVVEFSSAGTASTGTLAYFTLPGTTDYSSYQQITFWIRPVSTVPSNLALALCTDTIGTTVANSISIPTTINNGVWNPITINTGSAYSAGIKSVALTGSVSSLVFDFYLDNLEAVPAASSNDALSLNSLISKNTTNETWYAIKSIVGTQVELDSCPALSTVPLIGYGGSTQATATFRRETTRVAPTTSDIQSISWSGVTLNSITVYGGWNASSMDTQTSETWIDGQTGQGNGLTISGNYLYLTKIYQTRCNEGLVSTSTYIIGLDLQANNCHDAGLSFDTTYLYITNVLGCVGNSYGIFYNGGSYIGLQDLYNIDSNRTSGVYLSNPKNLEHLGIMQARYNASQPIFLGGKGRAGTLISENSATTGGIQFNNDGEYHVYSVRSTGTNSEGIFFNGGAPVHIYYLYTSGNTKSMFVSSGTQLDNYIYNAYMAEGTKVVNGTTSVNNRIYSQNEKTAPSTDPTLGILNNNKIYMDGGSIEVDTTDPNTPGGLDYTIKLTSLSRDFSYPIIFKIPAVFYNSGSAVTFTARVKQSNNTKIFCRFYFYGGSIPGITSDVVAANPGSGYRTYTATFTPTYKGATDIYFHVYSGTSTVDYVRIADFTLTQT